MNNEIRIISAGNKVLLKFNMVTSMSDLVAVTISYLIKILLYSYCLIYLLFGYLRMITGL
ncbi:MAG: hypothetical protein DHS20C13_09030 [Thermodesulfobacteriota bacterium]|nr:MAG: hypothetical protein DHS20C13_09030 [Thermodesulfobacteriota bacterium]